MLQEVACNYHQNYHQQHSPRGGLAMKFILRVCVVVMIGFALGLLVACSAGSSPPTDPPADPAASSAPASPSVDAEVQECVENAAAAAWMKGDQSGSPEDLHGDPQIISDCEKLAEGVDGAVPTMPEETGENEADPYCLDGYARDMRDLFPADMTHEEIMRDPMIVGHCL